MSKHLPNLYLTLLTFLISIVYTTVLTWESNKADIEKSASSNMISGDYIFSMWATSFITMFLGLGLSVLVADIHTEKNMQANNRWYIAAYAPSILAFLFGCSAIAWRE